ncbi:MAG: hypothetical protein E6Q88_05040 [Lysobacteraceae bacterium]|nr:MAG: hypothetical protein E6Q88_05040 [Xanthomonadaceae bacterium]
MPTLNEYLGGLFNSISNARVMSDIQTVQIAEQYAKHELLRHFPVPRMRIGDIELTVPVAIQGLGQRADYQLDPIGNDRFRLGVYKTICTSIGAAELPLLASNELNIVLTDRTTALVETLRAEFSETTFRNFAVEVTDRFALIAERYGLFKDSSVIDFRRDHTIESILKYAMTQVQGVAEKPVLDFLQVVAETHLLREQRPEDLIRLRIVVGESGMEWQTLEHSDGTIARKLLPE